MSDAIRTTGHQSVIWRQLGHKAPDQCPECGCHDSLHYIGFARSYTADLHATLYMCNQCNNWLDCVWPKKAGTMGYDKMQETTKQQAAV